MRDFRKFDFWEDGISFSVKINKLTSSFPIEERFALADQLRRSASSIPSNIAEGAGRGTIADFSHLWSFFLTDTRLSRFPSLFSFEHRQAEIGLESGIVHKVS